MSGACPLYPRKRTFGGAVGMSALCQRTLIRFSTGAVSYRWYRAALGAAKRRSRAIRVVLTRKNLRGKVPILAVARGASATGGNG
jgi:hypothetical protein